MRLTPRVNLIKLFCMNLLTLFCKLDFSTTLRKLLFTLIKWSNFGDGGFHRNGFSPKRVFTETVFHRNGFSPNPLLWCPFTERPFTEKYGFSSSASFHRMIHCYSPFNGDCKTGLRSSLAALEPEIQAFKVFSNF